MCETILTDKEIPCQLELCHSTDEVLDNYMQGNPADLLILDIMLGEENGIAFARQLREHGDDTSIILISSSDSFLLDGYSVQPVYFLLKPFSREDLEKAILTDLERKRRNKKIMIKCDQKQVLLPLDSILYVEVMDHALTIYTHSGNYITRSTLVQLLEMLPANQFCRCHNSYAVNLARVTSLSRSSGITLDCSITLPVGRKYYEQFQQNFIHFINRT